MMFVMSSIQSRHEQKLFLLHDTSDTHFVVTEQMLNTCDFFKILLVSIFLP